MDSVQTSLPKTSIETMTNYDKSPTKTWKRPTTWNPSPQKRFFSSPLFKCSATTRLKTQPWGPHVDPPKRTTWSSRRDTTRPVTWGKHGETTVTPTAVNFKKKLRLKNHLPALLQGSSYHPSKKKIEGEVYEKSTSLGLCYKLKGQSHSPFPTAKRCAMK